jgi:uncharacterized protein YgiM (DUF1202 family)
MKFRLSIFILLFLLVLGGTSVFAQAGTAGKVRFVHAIPGSPAVDVYVDSQLTIKGLDFGAASTYVNLPAGDHQIAVKQADTDTQLWQQSVSAAAGTAQTLVAVAEQPPTFVGYQDDLNPVALGKARLTAIHAISGAPTVDLALGSGTAVLPGLEFGKKAGTIDVPTNVYSLGVVPAGQTVDKAIVKPADFALSSGTYYAVLIYGSAEQPSTLLLSAPTTGDAGSGFVRVVHGVPGAPAVDVFANDTLLAPALKFGEATEHIAVPAGSYEIALRAAGSSSDLLTSDLTVEAGKAATAAALGTPDKLSVKVVPDNIGGIDAGKVRLSLINGIADATVSASLEDGTVIAQDVDFGGASSSVDVAPSSQAISLTAGDSTESLPARTLYGGVYYDVLAANQNGKPTLFFLPTSLAQGIASAPAPVQVVAAQPTTAATEPAVQVVDAPVQAAQPTAAPAQNLPTGRIVLDPGVNLQLRQYPNPQALSLGLAPSGVILTVNGREGAPEPLPNATVNPTATAFIDPAESLEPKQDLAPENTWLNVTYTTPDGGTITAWVNALYLDVRDAKGDKQRLADLPLVSGNLPGEVRDTSVTPPPTGKPRVSVVVINLDATTNLNIRRSPDTGAEVLARVPNGTVMEFLGIKQERDWVFVRYTPQEGSAVSGWVNAQYLSYTLNNRATKIEDLEQKNLLAIADPTLRGATGEGASSVVIPTVNPTKNAFIAIVTLENGANLNLRRNPNVDSEVIARIPNGTQLIVTSRTGDGKWLQVTFEDQTGWIAPRTDVAVFARLEKNGKAADIAEVPVVEGETSSITPVAPTQAPQGAEPTPTLSNIPMLVNDDVVAMTGSPGGDNQGLPILSKDTTVTLLFTDGKFSYIETSDKVRGWVPAASLRFK